MAPIPGRVQRLPNDDPQRERQHVQATICTEALAGALCPVVALQVFVLKIQEHTLHNVRRLRGAILSMELRLMLSTKSLSIISDRPLT